MVGYACKKCKRIFDQKTDYNRHMNRKTDCTKIKYGSKIGKKDHVCEECKKDFTREYSLKRHMNICKGKQVINITTNRDYNEKCTVNNNTTIKIKELKLAVFGKEGVEHITLKDLTAMLNSKTGLIESLVEKINFDPNKPEFHNIYVGDVKSGYGDIYEKKGWKTRNINEILNTVIDAKTEDINEILENYGDVLNDKTKEKLKDTVKTQDYKNIKSRKLMKRYLKAVLFNGSKMIKSKNE